MHNCLLLAASALICIATSQIGQAEIVRFDDNFYPRDVNSDGVVAGWYFEDGRRVAAIRHTDGGFQQLGFLHDVPNNTSEATRISDSGAVVGYSTGLADNEEAFRWTAENGFTGIGLLPGLRSSRAQGVSADGSTVTGYGSGQGAQSFVWTQSDGLHSLGQVNGEPMSVPHDISADSSTIVGGPVSAFKWEGEGRATSLSGREATAVAVSSDGKLVVGRINDAPGGSGLFPRRAVYWEGMMDHQEFQVPAPYRSSSASDITADGVLTLGHVTLNGTSSDAPEAVLWRIGEPPIFLNDLFSTQKEGDSLFDDHKVFASKISDNGRFIVGAAWGNGYWDPGSTNTDQVWFRATINLDTVPEPSSAWLGLFVCGAMLLKRRERKPR